MPRLPSRAAIRTRLVPCILLSLALPAAAATALADGINPSARAALSPAQEAAVEAAIERVLLARPDLVRRALGMTGAGGPGPMVSGPMVSGPMVSGPMAPGVVDPADGILGNPAGDVTLVAFVDRASPHSRAVMPVLAVLAATDPGLRVAVKELPLISRESVEAALAAAAARRQGEAAFRLFEAALMAHPGPADGDAIRRAASAAGLDAGRFAADRADPALLGYLRRTRTLAGSIGVAGTPAILVGGRAFAGTQPIGALREAIAEARERGR